MGKDEVFMIVERTEVFEDWLSELRDNIAKRKINACIDRIERYDFFGDCKPVGSSVFELRIHCGPGYRVYFYQKGELVILLLCGGNKKSQQKDIETAKRMIDRKEDKNAKKRN